MKVLKNKRIVVFEINDNEENRKYEYSGKYSGSNYKKPFADFIESLGFEVVVEDHIDEFKINGEEFRIYLGNASYMTKNAYTREVSVRKPINRYVSIMKSFDSTLLKVHFNKEYDGDKLCKVINDAIQSRIDARQFHEDKKNQDKENTIAVANHFISCNDDFKNIVEIIKIHQGQIQLMFDGGTLIIKPNKEFVSLDINNSSVNNETEIPLYFDKLITIKENTNKLLQIVKQNEFTSNIIEWCQNTYHRYYDVKELKYSEH